MGGQSILAIRGRKRKALAGVDRIFLKSAL
jgi:hypothetical protein